MTPFVNRLLAPLAPRMDTDVMDDRYWTAGGPLALTGVPINEQTALSIGAVWACVRAISDPLSSVPLITYRRQVDGGRQRAGNNPIYDLLHDRPNAWQTAREWRKQMMVYALIRGNGISRILPGPRGLVDQLIPIHPDQVLSIDQMPDYSLRYNVRRKDGRAETLLQDEVFHLRGLSLDGINGVSVIQYARETLGLAIASEQYAGRFFSQNGMPSVVLINKGKASKEARQHIRDEWEADVSGLTNAHKAAVLADDMKVEKLTLTAQDTQLLQTRQNGVEDVARWFGVPLHMIQSITNSTSWGSGIEQMSIGFVTNTLFPWAVAWEQTISRDLILDTRNYYAEHLFDALTRGTVKERYDAYHLALTDGWMNRNEVRNRENLNRADGLDDFLQQANMNPGDATPTIQQAHYKVLLAEATARVVRKESAALGRAWTAAGGDWEVWCESAQKFCETHAKYVEKTMAIEIGLSVKYVAELLDSLTEDWGQTEDIISDRLGLRADQLARMAMGEKQLCSTLITQ